MCITWRLCWELIQLPVEVIACEANVAGAAADGRGYPAPPEGMELSQICYVRAPDALRLDGEVAADLSLTGRAAPRVACVSGGFGWVAVSFAALSSEAAGRPMERSKVTLRGWAVALWALRAEASMGPRGSKWCRASHSIGQTDLV